MKSIELKNVPNGKKRTNLSLEELRNLLNHIYR